MDPNLVENVVIPLLAAHLIVDFLLQSGKDVKGKKEGSWSAYIKHGLQHGVVAWAMCGMFGAWSLALVLMLVHTLIDAAKEVLSSLLEGEKAIQYDGDDKSGDTGADRHDGTGHARVDSQPSHRRLRLFLGDQALHIISILMLASLWSGLADTSSWWGWAGGEWTRAAMLIMAGYLAATVVGGHATGLFVKPFLDEIERHRKTGSSRGLSDGGKAIGMLERTLIFVLILVGIESGVGFLVAAKSVLRFGEINDAEQRMEAEYIIIGTFLSFSWAIGCGWVARSLLRITGWM